MQRTMNGFAVMLITGTLIAAGCSSYHGSGARLTPSDFGQQAGEVHAAAPPAPSPHAPQGAMAVVSRPVPEPVEVSGPVAASEGLLDVVAQPGPPSKDVGGPEPVAVGKAVLVDEKIGDVNGRPIFASTILDPMANRLSQKVIEFQGRAAKENGLVQIEQRAYMKQKVPKLPWREAWMVDTQYVIYERLNSFIEDELLRAEAVASFTPDQKKGFFAFMDGLSDQLQRENGGTRSGANQHLQDKGGLDQYLKDKEEEELIRFQLYQKLQRRINISWRDVQLEYDRQVASREANRRVMIALIQVKADNAENIKSVTDALAAGRPFKEVASEPYNLNHPEKGGVEEKVPGLEYYANSLNVPAQLLQVGATAGPVAVGPYMYWLHREADTPPPIGPLYLEQAKIERNLWQLKFGIARLNYINRLKARTTMTSESEMVERLVHIAEERFLPLEAN